jgi:dihydroorotate dehydrogenase
MYRSIFRPLFFNLDPEKAHSLIIQLLRLGGAVPPARGLLRLFFSAYSQDKAVDVFGLKFSNPVGLAAGYDKDGLAWKGLTSLGFGHIEVGTVTPRPQEGNPKPRIFRIPEEQAVINRMGFPGKGADFVVKQLSGVSHQTSAIIGVNIGKNKDTPNEKAHEDYLSLMHSFAPLADYLAVNVSSPNTIGLRRLQARDDLEDLLKKLATARLQSPFPRPILVKLAPDLTDEELDDALDAISLAGMDGVIATNTTIGRDGLRSPVGQETGGLSGRLLTGKSLNTVQKIAIRTSGRLPIVGVGGIMNSDDAKMMLDSGATLIQLYTGLIFSGPGLVRQIVNDLRV